MLLDVSHNDKAKAKQINDKLGKSFSFRERIRMNGIGSPKLIISDASIQIANLLNLDNNRNVCNVEMRPKGIILGFRSLLNSYGLIIPYYKLVVYKGKANEYSIHVDNYFVKIEVLNTDKSVHRFMKKLILAKNEFTENGNENLQMDS